MSLTEKQKNEAQTQQRHQNKNKLVYYGEKMQEKKQQKTKHTQQRHSTNIATTPKQKQISILREKNARKKATKNKNKTKMRTNQTNRRPNKNNKQTNKQKQEQQQKSYFLLKGKF